MFFYVFPAREIHLKLNMPYREICICNGLSFTFSESENQWKEIGKKALKSR